MKRILTLMLVTVLLAFAACSVQDVVPGDGTESTITNEQDSVLVGSDAAESSGPADEPIESTDSETRPADGVQAPDLQEADVVISLMGRNFEYVDEAGNVNPTITVQEGDVVRVEYATESGFHDFVIDAFGATEKVRNDAGVQILEFTADQAGEFEYYCSVGSHRGQGMYGSFIVE
jgi:plastocyanin